MITAEKLARGFRMSCRPLFGGITWRAEPAQRYLRRAAARGNADGRAVMIEPNTAPVHQG